MKKHFSVFSSLIVLVILLLVIVPRAFADDITHRLQIELQLGLKDTYPHASSYYDDLVDHYEQELIMSDFIDKGIR